MKPKLIELEDGSKEWYLNDKLHREDGPALEWPRSGHKEWYINGKLHREDGPAVDFISGHKEWWIHGECHRGDGPAIEFADGTKAWLLNGKEYTREDYWKNRFEAGLIDEVELLLKLL